MNERNNPVENNRVLENCQKCLFLTSNSHIETKIGRKPINFGSHISPSFCVISNDYLYIINEKQMCEVTELCAIKVLNNFY